MSFDGSDICWVPDEPYGRSEEPRLQIAQFGDGYQQRLLDGINSLRQTWRLSWMRKSEEIIAMRDYLVAREGGAFLFQDPVTGETVNVWCDSWDIDWNVKRTSGQWYGELSAVFERAYGGALAVVAFGAGSPAGDLLGDEPSGFAVDFTQDSALVRSPTTPQFSFSGSPNDLLTYTAPSPKLVYGADGLLRWNGHNQFVQSENISSASWVKSNATVTADAETAPNGTVTADRLAGDGIFAHHSMNQNTAFIAGTTYTASIYAKKGDASVLQIVMPNTGFADNIVFANFDLDSGVPGTVGAGCTASMKDFGGGWYRCSITATADASVSSTPTFSVAPSPTAVRLDAWTTTTGIFVWGAQMERVVLSDHGPTDYLRTTTAARYALPIDRDPVAGAVLGVLVEEARTNLLLQSANQTTTWTTTNSTVTSNDAVAPDGTLTADKIVATAALNPGTTQSVAGTTAIAYTYSIYAKAGLTPFIRMAVTHSGGSESAWFDLVNGVIGSNSNAGLITQKMENAGNGWHRCSMTYTAALSAAHTRLAPADNVTTGNGIGDYLYVWGAQLEAGGYPTSHIPTTTAQVTRAKDAITLPAAALPIAPNIGTLFAEAKTFNTVDVGTAPYTNPVPMIILHAGVFDHQCALGRNDDTSVSKRASWYFRTPAGSKVAQGGNFTFMDNAYMRLAAGYDLVGGTFSYNGNLVPQTLPPVTGFSPTTLALGTNYATGTQLNGHLKSAKYLPRRATDAELQGMTT